VQVKVGCDERCELGICDPYCLYRDDGGVDGAGNDAGGSDAGGDLGDGGSGPRGECDDDADCGEGRCVAVPDRDGGWRVCRHAIAEATSCHEDENSMDACCTSTECTAQAGGGCFEGPIFYCGGAFPYPENVCLYHECQADADCQQRAAGLCIPAGAFGEPRNRCVYGDCRVDADCTTRSGGRCLPFTDPCARRLTGFFCTYDSSTCRTDADCRDQTGVPYCAALGNGQTECRGFAPPP
jgi:hypothetical protein